MSLIGFKTRSVFSRHPFVPSKVRNHVIHTSPSNLITIAGGKWTTYRSMAKETIDAAVEACDLPAKGSYTCDD